MTVSYTARVSDCRGFGNFWRLLFRWRGSAYKLVWPDILAFIVLYYTASFTYRFALDEDQRRRFEKLSRFCADFADLIPVSFVLGFYVNIVVSRWWEKFQTIPWPDTTAMAVTQHIQGNDRNARELRRTIVRQVALTISLVFYKISPGVKKTFPTHMEFVQAGLMTVSEKRVFETMSKKTQHSTHWMPLVWASDLVRRARKEGYIKDDFGQKSIFDHLGTLRGTCGSLLEYDFVSIPLVYTQVVTIAVYSFFLATLLGRQFLDPAQKLPGNAIDIYVPIFTLLQLFFYMGWLKVAESLVNPFGDDDDDFDLKSLVYRDLEVAYQIVDEIYIDLPHEVTDEYWDKAKFLDLPEDPAAPPLASSLKPLPDTEDKCKVLPADRIENFL